MLPAKLLLIIANDIATLWLKQQPVSPRARLDSHAAKHQVSSVNAPFQGTPRPDGDGSI
jgi:hypothetical protein